jgi:hypothetical protein
VPDVARAQLGVAIYQGEVRIPVYLPAGRRTVVLRRAVLLFRRTGLGILLAGI